ncbi:MaoC family dehydratase N-terminal domain-containing protein [Rhodococcus sp. IEGM 1307]|uniref:FAS1-like dehydratase domain-containing protein n=1 Tax=Rhodococcus sp. IEGM 1307 TaxID=3047091 RepID=UPI0024B65867|nr:MaoC family dehydratase N-terminal domain-containing protein [Rhodococcus sp. IEGM 1307]MDI9979791.1 MaoC family dehydratase N-terminal domain-containing protein [Rhodococcus sp. IEGM 1307]
MSVHRFPVEAGHILMFARAIGDENPIYTEPGSQTVSTFGGVLAPPTFVMASAQFAPENELRPKRGRAWFGSARESSGAIPADTGWLHAEQHFEYRRPLVAGETLDVIEREGKAWEKKSRRGGTLKFEERLVEYRATSTGELVTIARFVYVLPVPSVATK